MTTLTVPGGPVTAYGSSGASLHQAARVAQRQDGSGVDVVRLAPGGTICRHPTRLWQLFLVVSDCGWVSGAGGDRRVLAVGEAALWEPGEDTSGTEDGLVAVVVQCRVPSITEETS